MSGTLGQHLDALARERWRRQLLRTGLRALWVVAGIWCAGLGGHLIMGWPLRADLLGLLSLAVLLVAGVAMARMRLGLAQAARRLDRRFHLDEQLATALELARERQPSGSLAARVVADSAQTITLVRRQIARQQAAPLSDAIMLGAMLLMLGGMGLLWSISPHADAAALAPLPNLVTPEQQQQIDATQPTPDAGGPQSGEPGGAAGSDAGSQPSQADPALLGPIADALRGQGVTRPAAEALDQGDVAGAAQTLRELADQAGQISPQTRRNLARGLEQAADQIGERSPELASQLRESAGNLLRGDTASAQALEDLASALEQSQQPQQPQQQASQGEQGDQGEQQGDQGNQGEQQGGAPSPGSTGNAPAGEQRASQMPNLSSNGSPLELDAQGENAEGAGSSEQQPTTAEVVPSQAQGGQSGQQQQAAIGADPLRVPAEERDVVQDYFTP